MHARYINELTEGSRVEGAFLLRAKELRVARTGDAYLSFEIADRSGALPGVLFRPGREACEVPAGSVVQVEGTVTSFRGSKRVSALALRPAERWTAEDLISTSSRPVDELTDEFFGLARSIQSPGLKKLVRAVFADRSVLEQFCKCPATQSAHHACLSGLLEHTVAVASMAAEAASRYQNADRDLLVAAALLHDVGVIDELDFSNGITVRDQGRLVGHVVLSALRVQAAAAVSRADSVDVARLQNAVLAHHGAAPAGADPSALTLEAIVLRQLDELDSAAGAFETSIANALTVQETVTSAANPFERPLYAPGASATRRPPAASAVARSA